MPFMWVYSLFYFFKNSPRLQATQWSINKELVRNNNNYGTFHRVEYCVTKNICTGTEASPEYIDKWESKGKNSIIID